MLKKLALLVAVIAVAVLVSVIPASGNTAADYQNLTAYPNAPTNDFVWTGFLTGSTFFTYDVNPGGTVFGVYDDFYIKYETASNTWAMLPDVSHRYTYTDADADGFLDQFYAVLTDAATAGGQWFLYAKNAHYVAID